MKGHEFKKLASCIPDDAEVHIVGQGINEGTFEPEIRIRTLLEYHEDCRDRKEAEAYMRECNQKRNDYVID